MNEERNHRNAAGYTRCVVMWTVFVLIAGALAIGQINESPKPEFAFAELIPAAVAVEPRKVVEEAAPGGQIQSLSFKKDMSIKDALRFLSAKYQKNIVPSANVDGVVNVSSLYDVTFEQALDAILGYGFKYQQDGNFIKVYTADEYLKIKNDPDRMIQHVFTLYYVNATEMKKLITPALSANAIVASSTEPGQDAEAGEGGDSLAIHDTLIVYDYPENIERIAEMINAIDSRPPAILIEVTILEAQLKDETEFGIDFSSVAGAAISISSSEGITSSGFASSVTGSKGLTAAFSIDDITGFIRALESITDTTVLANPKIIALNKQAGHILIGSEDGYVTTSQISADGAVQQVEFLESGTTLKFRPYVCKNGYIRMEINPEQSTGDVTVSGDFVLPSKETTEVSTNIMVKDGKTVVIGGLFKDDISQVHSQVPVLGDLPIIGAAFEQIKDTVIRKELVVLITPHLIEDPEELEEHTDTQDITRVVEGTHESLKIINRTKLYEGRLAIARQYYDDGYYRAALAEVNSILEMRPNFPQAERLKANVMEKLKESD